MIRGFIFDLDGVITETDMLHYTAWRDEVSKHGINFTMEQNNQLKGLPRMDTLKGILRINDMSDKFTREQMEAMCKAKNDVYVASLDTSIDEKNILPGIKKLLEDARNAGIKMSICSSSRNAPKILKKIKLIDYFEFIVDPATIPNGKPAPDIYIAACDGINLKPSEVIGFEDAMPGVNGLVDAKVKCVAITHGEPGEWNKADMVLQKTNELDFEKSWNYND